MQKGVSPALFPYLTCKQTDLLSISQGNCWRWPFCRQIIYPQWKQFCIQQQVLNGFPGQSWKLRATRAMAGLWVPGVNKQGAQYPLTFGESEVFKQIPHENPRKWGFRHAKQLQRRDPLILACWLSSWGHREGPRGGFTLKTRWNSDLWPWQMHLHPSMEGGKNENEVWSGPSSRTCMYLERPSTFGTPVSSL